MTVTINGTTGITTPAVTNEGAYTGDGVVFADGTPSNTLVTTTGGSVQVGMTSGARKLNVQGYIGAFNTSGGNDSHVAIYNDGSTSNIASTYTSTGSYLPLGFQTGGSERMRISSSGQLFVGTTSDSGGSERFALVQNSDNWIHTVRNGSGSSPYGCQVWYTAATPNNTTSFFFGAYDTVSSTQTLRMQVRANGGIANYSGNNVNLSDAREKTNVELAGSYLDKICAIPVKTFNYIDQNIEEDDGLTLGVIAQEVQAVAPELVMESNWAGKDEEPKMRLSIYQTDLQYALMKCIQEQQAIITDLKARIETLENK